MSERPMIERLARVCAAWAEHHEPDYAWLAYQGIARLILGQMLAPTKAMAAAGEWRMVVLPIGNGREFHIPAEGEGAIISWRRMIEAALAEPDQTKPE